MGQGKNEGKTYTPVGAAWYGREVRTRVGFRTRAARIALGLTQAQVAQRARVSRSFVQRVEAGTANFRLLSDKRGAPFDRLVVALHLTHEAVLQPLGLH